MEKRAIDPPEVDIPLPPELLAEARAKLSFVESLGMTNTTVRQMIMKPYAGATEPIKWLHGWAEISEALNRDNDPTFKERVRNLNETRNGPLIFQGPGVPPVVDRAKLIEWWNGLYQQYEEKLRQERDKAATVSGTHGFGRYAVVVPEINGSVKHRRSDRKK